MGQGQVGSTSLTFTGSGDNLHFGAGSFISGDSEYAYGATSYVNGEKSLNFANFTRNFSANVQGPAFDSVSVSGDSYVRFRAAQTNQDLSFVSTWNLNDIDGTASEGLITFAHDPTIGSYVDPKNSFYSDTINLSFESGATMADGDNWRLFTCTGTTIWDWNELGAINLQAGEDTIAFVQDGMQDDYEVWTATYEDKIYQVAVNSSNYAISLSCSLSA